ncbi:Glutathione transport system permease protein GsiC [Thalassovita autumnalis]|uniref:Glutathione transport system permease protein GsiC n=1 Tax=Thalassovita autumnalis TaxID=2072972 RepID=A0A0N7LXP8_9RHOB|nr:ABC transporter permease [Thalassovita autumnalis]CUH66031.1 Glutathione transport system permease protein GsiC [Thalassovita autumnalis]CUH72503.1 Glutathione transport system permease protein GsiC [Thalassovita autumnalis]
MLTFIIRRLLITIPMMLVISFLVYLGLELTPGDAVSHMIDPEAAARMTEEQFAEMREALGLNKTFLERYWIWLTNVVQGNFGHSLSGGVAISTIVLDRLPATLELSVFALVFSTLIGCVLGTLSALRRGSGTDNALTVVGMLGVSIPEFFFGLVAILIFALNLGWLPAGGRLLPGYETFFDRLPHIVLPGIVLSLMMTAGVMRYARSSMLDSLSREFIRTARAKGLPAWRINLIHGFRVALTPVVVLIGFRLPTLIGGSVIIEQVFQWPGIGSEFIGAVRGSDYPLVMMIALLSVFAVLMASLIVDVLTALIDPRVRLG